MRYLCLVHSGPDIFSELSEAERRSFDRNSLTYDKDLEASGHFIAAEALQCPETAVIVKVRAARCRPPTGRSARPRSTWVPAKQEAERRFIEGRIRRLAN